MSHTLRPNGVESLLGEEELIVSKTDLKGRITYANDVFVRMAKYSYKELIGAPHSLIRHPDKPRCVFKLLWDTLSPTGDLRYVVNAADGSHYKVFAHVADLGRPGQYRRLSLQSSQTGSRADRAHQAGLQGVVRGRGAARQRQGGHARQSCDGRSAQATGACL